MISNKFSITFMKTNSRPVESKSGTGGVKKEKCFIKSNIMRFNSNRIGKSGPSRKLRAQGRFPLCPSLLSTGMTNSSVHKYHRTVNLIDRNIEFFAAV